MVGVYYTYNADICTIRIVLIYVYATSIYLHEQGVDALVPRRIATHSVPSVRLVDGHFPCVAHVEEPLLTVDITARGCIYGINIIQTWCKIDTLSQLIAYNTYIQKVARLVL